MVLLLLTTLFIIFIIFLIYGLFIAVDLHYDFYNLDILDEYMNIKPSFRNFKNHNK
jgi:hypothetical protein